MAKKGFFLSVVWFVLIVPALAKAIFRTSPLTQWKFAIILNVAEQK